MLFLTPLDVAGAVSESAAGDLARGLAIAGVLVVAIALGAHATMSFQTPERLPAPFARSIPWGSVAWSSTVIVALGGIVGLAAGFINSSIVEQSPLLFILGLPITWLFFASVVLSALSATWLGRSHGIRALGGPGTVGAIVALGVVITGLSAVDGFQRPPLSAAAHGSLVPGIQANVTLYPGAVGTNEVRVGLVGTPEALEELGATGSDLAITMTLSPLGMDNTPPPLLLEPDGEAAYSADSVVITTPGRWRITLNVENAAESVSMDVSISPNPRFLEE